MTVEEAIEHLKGLYVEFDYTLQDDEILQAIDMARKALEKQVSIEHQHTRVDKIDNKICLTICPNCFSVNYVIYKNGFPKYCNWCGQHMIKTFYESRRKEVMPKNDG